ncbi:hypothetical protein EX895_002909 [Sporisorium graminicola]|uniref:laccase n=1 Tax=Sporisorium graminicola TaxID=280036 RepID=A0A4V6ETW4_9BASI|nr:hypothetical protein EX895_002909 [Sporisorium graminicola]TKY88199.1 hypothetical protein EX895_002909 [Sporisorium graminicola]
MMVSQWPIRPGRWFEYRIPLTTEDRGTFFYHSHVGVQAMTAYGAVVVEDPVVEEVADPSTATVEAEGGVGWGRVEFVDVVGGEGLEAEGKSSRLSPYEYDEDRVLALGDWFSYSSTARVQEQLKGDPFVWPGSASKLLLNGRYSPPPTGTVPACNQTRANNIGVSCSSAPPRCQTSTHDYPTIYLDYAKTYRLRLIGATSLMYVSLAFLAPTATPYASANASSSVVAQRVRMDTMTLIEADGSYLDALEVEHVELAAGQRYSVLYQSRSRAEVERDAVGGVYWARVESRWRAGPSMWVRIVYPDLDSSRAVGPPVALWPGQEDVQLLPGETFGWVASQLRPLSTPGGPAWWYSAPMPPDTAVTRTVIIDTQQVAFYPSAKGVKWDENGRIFNEPAPPTAAPYLVRTFLGDIRFPTRAQFESAMYNPTTYPSSSSSSSSNGHAQQAIVDVSSPAEAEAAVRRKWKQGYDSALNMYFALAGEVVDIVLINKPSALSGSVEIHPWHMHSHKHTTRTIQPGTFSLQRLEHVYASSSTASLTDAFSRPVERDTTVAYASPGAAFRNQTVPHPDRDDGGWTVLRYKVQADNAGVFLLHCHIQFHLEMGMATVWTLAPDVLANRTGMYWPTRPHKGENGNTHQGSVEGLDMGYLEFDKNVSAVF